MKSEFDPYLNMTYVKLYEGAHFCLDKQRFLRHRTIESATQDLEKDAEKIEAIAADAIAIGSIEILEDANKLDNSIESLIAKLDLSIIGASYLDN